MATRSYNSKSGNNEKVGSDAQPITQANQATQSSPIENMSASAKPTVDSTELYTMDSETESVHGLVNAYADPNSAILKREAQKGRDMASARGLTNSTIASGNAIGAVLDKTTEWAKADAQHANDRKTASLQSVTNQYGTDVSAAASNYASDNNLAGTKYASDSSSAASKYSTDAASASNIYSTDAQVASDKYKTDVQSDDNKYNTDAQADSAKYNTDAQLAGVKYSSDQQLAGNKYDADGRLEGVKISADAQITAAGISSSAQVAAAGINASSNQKISAAQEATKILGIEAEKVAAQLSASTAATVAGINASANNYSSDASVYSSANGSYQSAVSANQQSYLTAVANIDQTADPKTQQEQMDRIQTGFDNNSAAINAWAKPAAPSYSAPVQNVAEAAKPAVTKTGRGNAVGESAEEYRQRRVAENAAARA